MAACYIRPSCPFSIHRSFKIFLDRPTCPLNDSLGPPPSESFYRQTLDIFTMEKTSPATIFHSFLAFSPPIIPFPPRLLNIAIIRLVFHLFPFLDSPDLPVQDSYCPSGHALFSDPFQGPSPSPLLASLRRSCPPSFKFRLSFGLPAAVSFPVSSSFGCSGPLLKYSQVTHSWIRSASSHLLRASTLASNHKPETVVL